MAIVLNLNITLVTIRTFFSLKYKGIKGNLFSKLFFSVFEMKFSVTKSIRDTVFLKV